MRSKLTAIFVIMVLVFATGGYFIAFKIERYRIRAEMKKRMLYDLPFDEIDCVGIHRNNNYQLDWERKGKEFRYRGKMYDVVATIYTADSIKYYCITDEDEESLLAQFNELISTQTGQGGATGKTVGNIFRLLMSLYYSFSEAWQINIPPQDSYTAFSIIKPLYSSGYRLLQYQPPKTSC